MKKRSLLIVTICLVLLVTLCLSACAKTTEPASPTPSTPSPAPQPSAQMYEWKLQPYLPETDPSVSKNVDHLIEMINANTDGRVKISKFPAGAICPGGEVLSAVATGTLDMSVSIGGYNAGAIPAAAVEDGLPLQWTSLRQMTEVLWDYGMEELMRPEYAKQGVYLIGLYESGGTGAQIFTTKQVTSIDQLKGKKIRTWGKYLTLVEKLGASPVSMPLPEVYSALQMGALDGVLIVTAVIDSNKFYEVVPFGLLPQFSWGATHSAFINDKKWQELPADLKTVVGLTFNDWKNWNARYYNPRFNYVTVEAVEKMGIKMTTLSAADIEKAKKAAYEIWDEEAAKDPVSAKAIDIVRQRLKDVPE